MTDEMKPCPFCGTSKPFLAEGEVPYVVCRSCESEGPVGSSRRAAIEAWNARAPVQSEGGGDEETWIANLAKQANEFDAAEKRFLTEESESRAVRAALSPAPVDPQLQATMDGIKAAWRYSINYGPDGEANYANVYSASGDFVGNLRMHHAKAIVDGMNVLPTAITGSALGPSAFDQHDWQEMTFGKNSGLALTCCTKCGYVRRADGKPNKPCKGRLAVVVRDPQS